MKRGCLLGGGPGYCSKKSPRDANAQSSLGLTGLGSKGGTSEIQAVRLEARQGFLPAVGRIFSWGEALCAL